MPHFMDIHNMPGVTNAKAAEAHQQDLAHQAKHGVKFTKYWVDEEDGKVFCLSEAPNKEAAQAVHAASGHPADEIYAVHPGH